MTRLRTCVEDYWINYNKLENRIQSFTKWQCEIDLMEMAVGGFYFAGIEDHMRLFSLWHEIFEWESQNTPLKSALNINKIIIML